MKKSELLALANIGKTEICGIKLEVIVRPSSVDGKDWLEIFVDPLTPLHQPLHLGEQWVEYISEQECNNFENALLHYKKSAEEFFEKAQRIVKATLTKNGEIIITDMPDSVKQDWEHFPRSLKWMLTTKHKIRFLNTRTEQGIENWFALGNFTLNLDGEIFQPHWSYWLEKAYYISTNRIKNIARKSI